VGGKVGDIYAVRDPEIRSFHVKRVLRFDECINVLRPFKSSWERKVGFVQSTECCNVTHDSLHRIFVAPRPVDICELQSDSVPELFHVHPSMGILW